jgi:HEAT repeat protein
VRPLKKEVTKYLEGKNYLGIITLSPSSHKIINLLITLTYDKSQSVSWRAMEAIGLLSKEIAKTDPEKVRNIVGRLLWMIRDESGGIGWSCPEMLGEIVRNNPDLCADIAPIIVSFHEEKMLISGVLWAIGRMGIINDETVGYAIPVTLQYLDSPDDTIRGYAAHAMGRLGAVGAVSKLEQLKSDESPIDFYEDGDLKKKRVGAIAEEALVKLNGT